MRTLSKNKQKMYYSLLIGEEPVYETDDDGNVVYDHYTDSDGNIIYYLDADGNKIPLETGEKRLIYSKPISFLGNITMSGGESAEVEFGVDTSQYSAVVIVDKNLLPITETSLIWYETTPILDKSGNVDETSADYKIVKINKSLNYDKYVLQKVLNNVEA